MFPSPRPTAVPRLPRSGPRRASGFTLTELLVAAAIILGLMTLIAGAASAARTSQKASASRSLIIRLDALLRAQIDRYANQSIPELRSSISPTTFASVGTLQIQERIQSQLGLAAPPSFAACRSLLLRARISADIPDRWSDVAFLAETIAVATNATIADQECNVLQLTLVELRDLLPQLLVAGGPVGPITQHAAKLNQLLQDIDNFAASVLEVKQRLRSQSPNLNDYRIPAFANLTLSQFDDALDKLLEEWAINNPPAVPQIISLVDKIKFDAAKLKKNASEDIAPYIKTDVYDPLTPQTKAIAARNRWLANMTPAQRAYLALWQGASSPPTAQFGGAECLFMVVMQSGLFDANDLGTLALADIGDKDQDGFPEFWDAWQTPIGFILWAPAVELPAGSGTRFFPLDVLAQPFPSHTASPTPPTLRMVPVVYSCGPDLSSGLAKTSASSTDENANLSQGITLLASAGVNSQLLDMRGMLVNRIASPQFCLLAVHPNCGNWLTSPTSGYGGRTTEPVDYRLDNVTNLDGEVRQ